jgi:hypothetical protein
VLCNAVLVSPMQWITEHCLPEVIAEVVALLTNESALAESLFRLGLGNPSFLLAIGTPDLRREAVRTAHGSTVRHRYGACCRNRSCSTRVDEYVSTTTTAGNHGGVNDDWLGGRVVGRADQ